MEFDYQILKLTDAFYQNYPPEDYPEMLLKESRAYNCLLIDLHYDYYICIPFRTEMHHKNGYKFRTSARSKAHQSGLDYSKMAIIQNGDYLGTADAVVDRDEYRETIANIHRIAADVDRYIRGYICHIKGSEVLNIREYERKYRYATLKYFHKELSIS